jgi:hypothetical protein
MKRLKLLGAAALLAATVTTPAFAQPVIQEPGAAAQNRPWVNDYDRYDAHPDSGYTAGPIVTAPFRGSESFAYYGRPGYGRSYDDSNAYYSDRPVRGRTTCGVQAGATYMGPDGRWYPC